MKKALILFSLSLGWASSSFIANASVVGDPAAGESMTVVCSACHGPDGNGAAPFPKLAGQGEKYLLKQLKNIQDDVRKVASMAGLLNGMSEQDLADIAAYYSVQQSTGGQTNPKLLELGAKIYRSGVADRNVAACIACHSPTGQGNAPAGFPALAGQHAQYIADQLRAYRKGYEDPEGRTNDGEAKIMRTNASGLSDNDIEAVSSYIAGLK
jgi:cytochrome c553